MIKLTESEVKNLTEYVMGQVFFDLEKNIINAVNEWVSMVNYIETSSSSPSNAFHKNKEP